MFIKDRKVTLIIFSILFLIGIAAFAWDINSNKNRIVEVTRNYLLMNNDYNSNEIKDIKVSYYFDRLIFGYEPYIVSVVLRSNPNIRYYYSYKNGKLYQFTTRYEPLK